MKKEILKSYISKLAFILSRTKYSYSGGFELIFNNNEGKINGTVSFRIGIAESEVIFFESKFTNDNDTLTFKSKYCNNNYRAKQRPTFMGGQEYTSETEGKYFEEIDSFTLVQQTKKNFLSSPKQYLIHSVDGIPNSVYLVGKKFDLSKELSDNFSCYPLDESLLNIEYNQVDEIVKKQK